MKKTMKIKKIKGVTKDGDICEGYLLQKDNMSLTIQSIVAYENMQMKLKLSGNKSIFHIDEKDQVYEAFDQFYKDQNPDYSDPNFSKLSSDPLLGLIITKNANGYDLDFSGVDNKELSITSLNYGWRHLYNNLEDLCLKLEDLSFELNSKARIEYQRRRIYRHSWRTWTDE